MSAMYCAAYAVLVWLKKIVKKEQRHVGCLITGRLPHFFFITMLFLIVLHVARVIADSIRSVHNSPVDNFVNMLSEKTFHLTARCYVHLAQNMTSPSSVDRSVDK